MLLKIIFVFIAFNSLSYAKIKTSVSVNGLEVTINDHRLSSYIFHKTKISPQNFDLISGVYKMGKYIYCKTMITQMRCFIYLSNNLDGSFSSPWSDSDFGMTGPSYMHNSISKSMAYFEEDQGNVYISFSGKAAKTIFEHSAAAKLSFGNLNEEIRSGKHISCQSNSSESYVCTLKLVLNDHVIIKTKRRSLELF